MGCGSVKVVRVPPPAGESLPVVSRIYLSELNEEISLKGFEPHRDLEPNSDLGRTAAKEDNRDAERIAISSICATASARGKKTVSETTTRHNILGQQR
mmetsp:Transcript_8279/g.15357  ORF Transcript_8279/g.15357 Transcript_8279/m.15357 type:complete len:98 (-) Transcript_8279:146-439(-)